MTSETAGAPAGAAKAPLGRPSRAPPHTAESSQRAGAPAGALGLPAPPPSFYTLPQIPTVLTLPLDSRTSPCLCHFRLDACTAAAYACTSGAVAPSLLSPPPLPNPPLRWARPVAPAACSFFPALCSRLCRCRNEPSLLLRPAGRAAAAARAPPRHAASPTPDFCLRHARPCNLSTRHKRLPMGGMRRGQQGSACRRERVSLTLPTPSALATRLYHSHCMRYGFVQETEHR